MRNTVKLDIQTKTKGKSKIDTKMLEIIKENQENKLKEIKSSSKKVNN